jgi:hypothetical protein
MIPNLTEAQLSAISEAVAGIAAPAEPDTAGLAETIERSLAAIDAIEGITPRQRQEMVDRVKRIADRAGVRPPTQAEISAREAAAGWRVEAGPTEKTIADLRVQAEAITDPRRSAEKDRLTKTADALQAGLDRYLAAKHKALRS